MQVDNDAGAAGKQNESDVAGAAAKQDADVGVFEFHAGPAALDAGRTAHEFICLHSNKIHMNEIGRPDGKR